MDDTSRKLDRRQFSTGLIALAGASLSAPALAADAPKIVIVGGGPGGATVAVNLIKANPKLDITIVEPNRIYTSCFFSNHYIAGLRPITSLSHTYEGLRRLGITIAVTHATAIDTAKKTVQLLDRRLLPYDNLVVAPGIEFKYDTIEGYNEQATLLMPHAWRGVFQTRRLRAMIDAMPNGGLVLIAPPKLPYRCPPGPYERACAIATYLKLRKPKSKLVIVDAKMSFSKQPVFEEAFRKRYGDMIELHLTNDIDDMSVAKVDPKAGLVVTKSGQTYKPAVANIIPQQRAGSIAADAGLTEGDWCPVDLETFKSTKAQGVYVVGDSAMAAEMPKSAFTAHNQAKFVAETIIAEFTGRDRPPARFRNTCWSLLAPNDSVKIGADYAPGEVNGHRSLVPSGSFVSQPDEKPDLRNANYFESIAWYDTLTNEVFAKDSLTSGTKAGKQPSGKG